MPRTMSAAGARTDPISADRQQRRRSDRGRLVSLSLSMLLSSLGTNVANVALPTLTQAFKAPFPNVQWIVLA